MATSWRSSLLGNLTPAARSVVMDAEKHALSRGHDWIGSEHLLLAILSVEASAAVRVLVDMGLAADDVRVATLKSLPRGQEAVAPPVPFTSLARMCLENAMREAVSLRSRQIGPEHLLLGILRAGDRGAGALLLGLGVDRTVAREAVAALPASERLPVRRRGLPRLALRQRRRGVVPDKDS